MKKWLPFFVTLLFAVGPFAKETVSSNQKPETQRSILLTEYNPDPVIYSLSNMGIGMTLLCIGGPYTPRASTFAGAYTDLPEWENDPFIFNYILHPLWGSETYLRARENDYSVLESAVFSMGASIFWEYVIESWIKQPSVPDLIFTTGIGWPLGEMRYYLKNNLPDAHDWWIDPLYSLFRQATVTVASIKEKKQKKTVVTVSWKF